MQLFTKNECTTPYLESLESITTDPNNKSHPSKRKTCLLRNSPISHKYLHFHKKFQGKEAVSYYIRNLSVGCNRYNIGNSSNVETVVSFLLQLLDNIRLS